MGEGLGRWGGVGGGGWGWLFGGWGGPGTSHAQSPEGKGYNAAAPLGLVSQENEENPPKTIKTPFSTSPAKTLKKVSKK